MMNGCQKCDAGYAFLGASTGANANDKKITAANAAK
jgi:hypothetical protein